MGKTIPELHAMLRLAEKGIPKKTPVVLAIRQELKKNKASASGTSGIFTIELFSFPKSNSWIYDTGCGTYICNTIQGLRGYRKLNKGALDLYVGNGNTATVEAIGSYNLILPSGMILVLDNCHFSPSITRGVISLSRLWDNGIRYKFIDNGAILQQENKHNLDSTFLWHCRLGHINKKRIEKLLHDGLLKSIDDESFNVCVSCISGKMARNPFTHASERADDLLGIIHSDVCRPFRTTSRDGANYYVTFTDNFSRYGYVYLIQHNHEVFGMFKTFQNEVENQLGKTIKALRSDRGGEYLSQVRYRTLLDMVQSMMSLTTLPMSFWGYALESAARILNMVPTKKALVKRDTPNKLESRSIKCIFIGYPKETMGYYLYYPLENKIFVARYAEVFKTRLIKQEASRSTVYFDEIQSEEAQPSENTSLHQHEHKLGDYGKPPNYQAALLDLESEKWLEAMNMEMQSMKDNQVWNLVDLPPNCKTVGSKWLFKKKTNMDGNIHTYKARLVAKGFTQTYGVDYEETFSPVADIKAIRILIAITAYYDYEIWQMDVKTAFLNGRINDDVYMVQPEGFVNPKHPGRVCKLQRSIYGLKQASKSWNKRFDEEIKKYGFTQNPDKPCVYKRASGSNTVFLILYVDDILLMGNNIPMLKDVKSWLGKSFSMKDLVEAAYILGIKIYHNRSK
ncbi:putative RNA-directed DNA polymerase, partial [Tanacetum coccineum]